MTKGWEIQKWFKCVSGAGTLIPHECLLFCRQVFPLQSLRMGRSTENSSNSSSLWFSCPVVALALPHRHDKLWDIAWEGIPAAKAWESSVASRQDF